MRGSMFGTVIMPVRVRKYTWKLDETKTIVFDGNGSGNLTFIPGGARERWEVHFISVSAGVLANSINVPTLRQYRGSLNGPQIGGTYSGQTDSTTDPILLNMNEGIAFQFTGGDPGQTGTVHLEGLRYVWGN